MSGTKMLVSKVSINPSRSVDMGPSKGWVTLQAGVDIVLDPPTDDKVIIEGAFAEARKLVKEEMAKQYEPFKKKADKGGGK